MPSLRRQLPLILLLALLFSAAPAARPAFAQEFTVTVLGDADDGLPGSCGTSCSLREAIRLANENAGPDTISFSFSGSGPFVIAPATPLPALVDNGTTIDGTNKATGAPRTVVIDGSIVSASVSAHGLVIASSDNEVRNLVIGGFTNGDTDLTGGSAIFVDGSIAPGRGDNNRIYGNWLGVGYNGSALDGDSAFNNDRFGVRLFGGASNNRIGGTGPGQGNVIAGGGVANIGVGGAGETSSVAGNIIAGNFIGTNVAGTARPTGVNTDRTQGGINIDAGANGTVISDNLIGGHTQGQLSNNVIAGVFIAGNGSSADGSLIPTGTVLLRNLIGVNAAGAAVPNRVGIAIGGAVVYGPYNTTIGDPANPAGGRNVIAGNTVRGIEIKDSSFKFGNVVIAGNVIGLSPAGSPLPNGTNGSGTGGEGVFVGQYDGTEAGPNPVVTVGPANVISANIAFGVRIRSGGHSVRGNYLGTNLAGSSSNLHVFSPSFQPGTANGAASVWVENGNGVTIGGATAADRNVIAFSGSALGGVGAGILVNPDGLGVAGSCGIGVQCATGVHTIRNNYIGVGAAGSSALNGAISSQAQREGIRLFRSDNNTLQENVIGGLGIGVTVGGTSAPANNNTLLGNRVGTGAGGLTSGGGIPLREEGIRILAGSGNRIEDNLVAYAGAASNPTAYHGIRVGTAGGGANNNQLIGNRLVNNGAFGIGDGVRVDSATGVRISRTETTGNQGFGIRLGNGGNGGRAVPGISAVTPGSPPRAQGSVSGCDGCTIEIFASANLEPDEGPLFVASGTATGGSFDIPVPSCLRYLTATVTDGAGNSSPFSAPFDSGANGPCLPTLTLTLGPATPNALNAAPGSSATYTHRLTHNAQVARSYTIVYTSSLGWASAPTLVEVPAAPAGGTSFADFDVVVTVPVGTSTTPPVPQDVTRVRAVGGAVSSAEQTDTTTVQAVVQNPAAPAVSPGQTKPFAPNQVTFTHTVTNTGNLAGTFDVLDAQLVGSPAGFAIQSAILADPTLDGGQSTTLTIVVSTPAAAPAPGTVLVRFAVGVQGGSQTPTVDDAIVVAAVRSFTFTPATPQSATTPPGADVSFDYVLTNTGNAPDTFNVIGAATGTGNPLTFVSATATPPVPGLANLPPNTPVTVRVTFRVPPGTSAGDYGVSATASAVEGPGRPADEARTATVTVTGGGSATITPGTGTPDPVDVRTAAGTVVFTNTVTNSGNQPVAIVVPASFSAPNGLSAATTANSCDDTPTIADGASCTFTVTVTVPEDTDAGSYSITVSATADNAAPTPDVTATAVNTVNVLLARGVELAPDRSATGGPGQLLTFTHTLTNTGNGVDSFSLSAAPSLPGWSVLVTPTLAPNLPRDGTLAVTVTARVPAVAVAGATNTITVTATGSNGGPSDSVVDAATVAAVTAADLGPGGRRNLDAGATASFTHSITNTGSTTAAFRVEAADSGAGWSSAVSGSPTRALAPGEVVTVTVQVTAPAAAEPGDANTTSLRLFADGTTAPLLDDEEDVSIVGPALGVLITPDNSQTGLPETTLVFTHTLTNIGSEQGLFSLTVAERNGWPATVTPSLVNLGGRQSVPVEVRVSIPDGTRADPVGGAPSGFARVSVELIGDPDVADSATDEIRVGRLYAVDLSASQVRRVNAGGPPQTLTNLTVNNRGNDVDSFDLRAINVPAGWGVTLTPATVTIDKNGTFRVAIRVSVPDGLEPRTIRRLQVEARSRGNPAASDTIELTLVYDPARPTTLYLPLLRR